MAERKNNKTVYLALHILLCVYSFGGIFAKLAANEKFLSFDYLKYYSLVLLNLFVYAIVWQQIIKKIQLSVAYANKGVNIIWSIVFGCIFFGEAITLRKIIGAVIIIIGIIIVVSDDE